MVHQYRISVPTRGYRHMQDITQKVAECVDASGVRAGVVHVFNIGSTGAVGMVEFEPGLQRDVPEMLDKLIPPSRITVTSRPGTTATATPTCRPRCSDHRFRFPSPRGNWRSARGSRSSTWNATSSRGERTIVVTILGE